MDTDTLLRHRIDSLFPHLTERQRRLAAAANARALGYGGISQVARATGMSRATIHQGLAELDEGGIATRAKPSAGRRSQEIRDQDPSVLEALAGLGGPLHAGRSDVAAAMDVQEHAATGGRR